MTRILAIVVALICSIAGTAFGWNYYHQHSLSPEVEAAVIAALNESGDDGEENQDLHAAMLAVRTKRDVEIVRRLSSCLMYFHFAALYNEEDLIAEHKKNETKSMDLYKQLRNDVGLPPIE